MTDSEHPDRLVGAASIRNLQDMQGHLVTGVLVMDGEFYNIEGRLDALIPFGNYRIMMAIGMPDHPAGGVVYMMPNDPETELLLQLKD